jgi:UDP-N-acetylglucosamine acyltransferase
MMQQGFDNVVGVNVVGLRRAGISGDCINAIRRAFHILYREGHLIPVALARIEKELAAIDVITALVQFIRQSSRGINMMHDRRPEAA